LDADYDHDVWGQHLLDLEKRRPFRDFVYRCIAHGNVDKWMQVAGKPVFDEQGNFQGYRGSASDVTAEVTMRERLKASEALLRDAIENLGAGFVLYDAEDRFVTCNQALRDMLPDLVDKFAAGTPNREITQAVIERRLVAKPEADPTRYEAMRGTARAGGAQTIEVEWHDGRILRMEDRRTSNGGLLGLRTDVTALRRADAALRANAKRQRRQFQALAKLARSKSLSAGEIAAQLPMICEQVAKVLEVTRVGVWLYTADRQAIVSQHLYVQGQDPQQTAMRLATKDYPAYFDALDELRTIAAHDAPNDPRTAEFAAGYLKPLGIASMLDATLRTSEGVRGVLCCEHVGPARHWSEDEISFAGSVADILSLALEAQQRRQTEQRLRQAQKMEAVGQLTGGIAHDFNNRLAVVVGNLDMLEESIHERPREHELVARVIEAAERGASLTRQLLAFSQQQALEPARIDVAALLETTAKLLRRALGATYVIAVKSAPDLWQCAIDPTQTEAAILNLAINARDAMPQGGSLTIEASNVDEVDGEDGSAAETIAGQFVLLAVTDTDTGMSSEVLARVFEPFFTTKDVGQGSGLGLSMVHGFVQQSGGQIRIHSELGVGMAVRLYLPRAQSVDEEKEMTDIEEPTKPQATQQVILAVEDDSAVRTHVAELLRGLGYQVVVAPDANAALRLLQETPGIELLFTDVILPGGMTGADLAVEARRQRPQLKVLFTSGYPRNAITQAGFLGADAEVLAKPYRRTELATKLSEVLARKAAA